MKIVYSKEVTDYLNNKFGDDFTLAEPYPYWMKAPDGKEDTEPGCWIEPDRPMTATGCECWYDTALDLRLEILDETGGIEDNNNILNNIEL